MCGCAFAGTFRARNTKKNENWELKRLAVDRIRYDNGAARQGWTFSVKSAEDIVG